MPPDTPPPTTYDHKPAYDFAESMRPRCEYIDNGEHLWASWALVEAYMAGRAEAKEEGRQDHQWLKDE